jgi:hypothetical protein
MAGPRLFRRRALAEQNFAIWSDKQRADGSGGLILHGGA